MELNPKEKDLSRLDKALNKIVNLPAEQSPIETKLVTFGPQTLMNLVQTEIKKLAELNGISSQLINYFCSPSTLTRLTTDEKRKLLLDIAGLEKDSRDFILQFAELGNKNALLNKIINSSLMAPTTEINNVNNVNNVVVNNHANEVIDIIKDIINEKRSQQ